MDGFNAYCIAGADDGGEIVRFVDIVHHHSEVALTKLEKFSDFLEPFRIDHVPAGWAAKSRVVVEDCILQYCHHFAAFQEFFSSFTVVAGSVMLQSLHILRFAPTGGLGYLDVPCYCVGNQ